MTATAGWPGTSQHDAYREPAWVRHYHAVVAWRAAGGEHTCTDRCAR